MSRFPLFLACPAILAFGLGLSGCGGPEEASPGHQGPEAAGHGHGDQTHHGEPEDSALEAALAKLPAADRAAAEKQRICPVSGQLLGSMGTPIKVTVKGQEVFLCCAGCKKSIEDDPDTYLAKLNK